MSRVLTIITYLGCSLLIIASLCGLVWVNTQFAKNNPGEKDFMVPWLAARTFLQYGNNPYSDSVSQRAQIIYYGQLANSKEDPLRLNVPFPLELFFFPFAMIPDYALARGFWMALLEVTLLALGLLSMQLTGWKPVRTLLPLILLFSVFWIYNFLPLASSHPGIIVALAVIGFLISVREQRDELAGALLVLPFFSPVMMGVFVIFILWWTFYHRRWRILAGFLMTMTILFVLGFILLPDWFMPFIKAVISHITFNPGLTPGSFLRGWWPVVGPRLGWILTIILLAILFLEWRNVRTKDFQHFLWTSCLTLTVTPLLGIPVIPQNEVVLFLPLILFLTILGERWSHGSHWGIQGFAVPILLIGTWLVSLELFTRTSSAFTNNLLVLLLPAVLMIGLYWMRWWSVRPPRTWIDGIL